MPKQQEAKIIFKDEKLVELTSDSLMNNFLDWKKEPDTLIFYLTHYKKVEQTTLTAVTDTFKYPKEDINKIFIEEYDATKTILVIILGISIGFVIYGYHLLWQSGHPAN
jgi:ribosomal protein S18